MKRARVVLIFKYEDQKMDSYFRPEKLILTRLSDLLTGNNVISGTHDMTFHSLESKINFLQKTLISMQNVNVLIYLLNQSSCFYLHCLIGITEIK